MLAEESSINREISLSGTSDGSECHSDDGHAARSVVRRTASTSGRIQMTSGSLSDAVLQELMQIRDLLGLDNSARVLILEPFSNVLGQKLWAAEFAGECWALLRHDLPIHLRGQAEYRLQRTDEEIDRLVVALRDLQAQRRPIWPAPAGTSADKLLAMLVPPRLRQPSQGSQLGQTSSWEGGSGPAGQQWQVGSSWTGQNQGGGIPPLPSPGTGRGWSQPPERYGSRYGDTGRDSALGQQMPSMPPAPPLPVSQDPASSMLDQGWPSLDPASAHEQQWGTRTNDAQSATGGSFPPLDNPWYLPPDE